MPNKTLITEEKIKVEQIHLGTDVDKSTWYTEDGVVYIDRDLNVDGAIKCEGAVIKTLNGTATPTSSNADVDIENMNSGIVRVDNQKGGTVSIGDINSGGLYVDKFTNGIISITHAAQSESYWTSKDQHNAYVDFGIFTVGEDQDTTARRIRTYNSGDNYVHYFKAERGRLYVVFSQFTDKWEKTYKMASLIYCDPNVDADDKHVACSFWGNNGSLNNDDDPIATLIYEPGDVNGAANKDWANMKTIRFYTWVTGQNWREGQDSGHYGASSFQNSTCYELPIKLNINGLNDALSWV